MLRCFGRHVKPLVPAAFAVVTTHSSFKEVLTSGRRPVEKIIAESLSQYDEKHVVPTDPTWWDKGRKKKTRRLSLEIIPRVLLHSTFPPVPVSVLIKSPVSPSVPIKPT
jgi:hypothetical protein